MAKTLKEIFSTEERVPLPNDETNKKVKAKHPVKKTEDANGNDDALFKASKLKPSKTNANKDAVSEAVDVSNTERRNMLDKVKQHTKGGAAVSARDDSYDAKRDRDSANRKTLQARNSTHGKDLSRSYAKAYHAAADEKSKSASLKRNASKVVHKEDLEVEKDQINESTYEQNIGYMNTASKKCSKMIQYISKLSTAKDNYGSSYYYDAKYLSRQLEDLCDELERVYTNFKNNKTKGY